jgi:hypothetical protein
MPLEAVNSDTQLHESYQHTKVNFGSIFAGAFVTVAIGLVCLIIGNAIGLGAIKMLGVDVGGGIKTLSFIYNLLAFSAACFAGAYCTTRIAGIHSSRMGAMYGLATWALAGVSTVAFGITQSFLFSDLIGGLGPNLANWFMVLLCAVSCAMAIQGGFLGSTSSGIMGVRIPQPFRRAA